MTGLDIRRVLSSNFADGSRKRLLLSIGIGRRLLGRIMADVGTPHPEDDIFGDVRSVVGNALEIARNQQRIQSLAGAGNLHILGAGGGKFLAANQPVDSEKNQP